MPVEEFYTKYYESMIMDKNKPALHIRTKNNSLC